ncbi:hypothetical protein [Pseudarthrobacter sp. ATCC 49987]|uniref:hypothetical protein n=1 Tax=Pseudarthrobacter sp. ATCC 49987 TaxID=2698204 RepID=UPI00136CA662|nr:hypothetical protein [Pseudarthrobacter sp. ATCC 49987]
MRSTRSLVQGTKLAGTASAGAVALCLLAGGGTAYAYWASTGSGIGAAAAGTMQISVDASVAGDSNSTSMVPGGTADVILRTSNPNAFAVTLYSVAASAAATADAAHAGCTTTGVSFTAPATPLAPAVTIPAKSSVFVTLPGAASMSAQSQSACQGATFKIPVKVEARR